MQDEKRDYSTIPASQDASAETPAAGGMMQGARVPSQAASFRSEAQLKAMIRAFDGLIYVCSQDYRIEFMNERLIERTGYDATGELCYKVLHDRDSICDWCVNPRVLKGETVRWETKSPKDSRWYYIVNTPLYNENNTVSKMAMIQDITDRKNAEDSLREARDSLGLMVEERTAELVENGRKLMAEIEERRRTERALLESEGRYRSVVDHIGIGVALISPNMEILTLNKRMKKWFPHIETSKKPLCYQSFNTPPLDDVCAYCPAYKTLKDGKVHEAVSETPVGNEIRNYRLISTPIRDIDGNIIAAVELVEDITARLKMQEKLLESEIKYRAIFETSAAATMIIDETAKILLVNSEFERLTGFSKEEVEDRKSWLEIIAEEDRPRLQEYHRLLGIDGESIPRHHEYRLVNKSGDIRDIYMTVAMIPGTKQSVSSHLDITDRKRVEEAHRQTSAYLENVFENSPDAIGIVDKHGKLIMWNKMAAELYGYSFGELRGKSSFDLYADKEELGRMLARLRETGSVNRWEMLMKRKGGGMVPCDLSIGLLKDSQGGNMGSVCVARDLTDIKKALTDLKASNARLSLEIGERTRAEEELSRYRDRLEELVKERTEELARANEMLMLEIAERKGAEEALKFFSYSVAHDLKSPAIGIYGLTKRLYAQYKDILDEKAGAHCDQILKASEHIADLVEKVNVYIATRESGLSLERISVKEILSMLKDEFAARLTDRRIEWLEPEADIEFYADRLAVLRVFRNLIDNALKYGGERLTKICIAHEETEGFVILSVTDNGRGLKEGASKTVFTPFQRHETSRGIEGAGLGLSIVREIARQHGGEVWVTPASRKGTTFCISISKDL